VTPAAHLISMFIFASTFSILFASCLPFAALHRTPYTLHRATLDSLHPTPEALPHQHISAT
jgi:hypothetical protein